ncbi:MAG: hypothetical protein JSS72_10765 [Armatimonadetes bacterium]|nr:hypothetical protein [Armatimonadota bacterium]
MNQNPANWPPELDATIAAPSFHKLLFENEHVRVLDTRVEPGQIVPLHTHPWPIMHYIFAWNDFIRRDENGDVLVDTKAMGVSAEPGTATWSAPMGPHTLENVGDGPIHVLVVELKSASQA